jgi:hypothetical protein
VHEPRPGGKRPGVVRAVAQSHADSPGSASPCWWGSPAGSRSPVGGSGDLDDVHSRTTQRPQPRTQTTAACRRTGKASRARQSGGRRSKAAARTPPVREWSEPPTSRLRTQRFANALRPIRGLTIGLLGARCLRGARLVRSGLLRRDDCRESGLGHQVRLSPGDSF